MILLTVKFLQAKTEAKWLFPLKVSTVKQQPSESQWSVHHRFFHICSSQQIIFAHICKVKALNFPISTMTPKGTAVLQKIYQAVATVVQCYFFNDKTRNYIILSAESTHTISSLLIAFKNRAKPRQNTLQSTSAKGSPY